STRDWSSDVCSSDLSSVAYGRADGMQSRECNGGTQPVAWKTNDGKLWFATVKGVAMIDPNRARGSAAPPLIIQDILAGRRRLNQIGRASWRERGAST